MSDKLKALREESKKLEKDRGRVDKAVPGYCAFLESQTQAATQSQARQQGEILRDALRRELAGLLVCGRPR